jgi:hypothetical protein
VRESGIRYCTVCNYDFVAGSRAQPPPGALPQAGGPQHRVILPTETPRAEAPARPGDRGPARFSLRRPERRYPGSVSGLPRRILVLGLLVDVLIVVLVMLFLGHRL